MGAGPPLPDEKSSPSRFEINPGTEEKNYPRGFSQPGGNLIKHPAPPMVRSLSLSIRDRGLFPTDKLKSGMRLIVRRFQSRILYDKQTFHEVNTVTCSFANRANSAHLK